MLRALGRVLWWLLLVAVVLVGAGYAALPWLAGGLAPYLAMRAGLDTLELHIGRPGISQISVDRVVATSGGVHLDADGVRISYRLLGLLTGRLTEIDVRRLAVEVRGTPDTPGTSTNATPLTPAALFAALPAERVQVASLILGVPALDFVAHGNAGLTAAALDVRLRGVSPAEAVGFRLDASLRTSGAVALDIADASLDQAPFLAVRSQLEGSRLHLDGSIQLHGFAFDLAAQMAGWPPGRGELGGTFAGQVDWPLPTDVAVSDVAAEGRVEGHWRAQDGSIGVTDGAADWRLAEGHVSGQGRARVAYAGQRIDLSATAQSFDLLTPGGGGTVVVAPADGSPPYGDMTWTVGAGALKLDGNYRVGGALLTLASELAGQPLGDGELGGDVQLSLPWPLPEALTYTDLPASGTVSGRWRWPDPALALNALSGTWQFAAGRATADLTGRITVAEQTARVQLLVESAELFQEPLEARGSVAVGEGIRGPFVLRHHPGSGAGELGGEVTADTQGVLLGQVLERWRGGYDVTGGRLTAQAALRWQDVAAPGGRLRITLNDVDAHYQDYRIAGLSTSLLLTARDGDWRLEPARLEAASVDVGVVLESLRATLAWSGDVVSVSDASAALLGGRARVTPFEYRTSTGQAAFTVALEDLALAQILALEGEQISGTGRLDGTLPVQISGNLPSVAGGRVTAQPPGGVLRVAPALAAGTGQPGLDFAVRALQDFRYSALSADAGYAESGDLTLAVRLEGRNPQVEGGRPIHYNVTVSEHLPTLLEALQLQDRVTRSIEQRVTN